MLPAWASPISLSPGFLKHSCVLVFFMDCFLDAQNLFFMVFPKFLYWLLLDQNFISLNFLRFY
uniref:Uncharacterized protein n=1 Tax=Manihot esculenta TaxID=3983 RepID=A0A2C9WHP6_MANES